MQEKEKNLVIANYANSAGLKTYEGIDVIGDSLTTYIIETVKEMEGKGKTINKVSLIGYSLGGLAVRYSIGKVSLHVSFDFFIKPQLYSLSFFEKYQPINLITFSTPHLGTLRKPSFFNTFYNFVVRTLILKTGAQLNLADEFIDSKPLLVIMADPDLPFMKAIGLFHNRALFVNVCNDRTVRFTTGNFSHTNPYKEFRRVILFDQYPSIVSVDVTQRMEKELWTKAHHWRLSLFIAFSPILIPVIFCVVGLVLPICALYKV